LAVGKNIERRGIRCSDLLMCNCSYWVFMIMDSNDNNEVTNYISRSDDEVIAIADNLMDEFDEAFKELAK